MSGKLTAFQRRCLEAMAATWMIESADDIAYRLRPKSGRLAVSSALRPLLAAGFVVRVPPEDQWSTAKWNITEAGRASLSKGNENNE